MRDVIKTVKVECPYCQEENKYLTSKEGKLIVYCDTDTGGCGRPFVVDYQFSVEVEIFRLEPVEAGPYTELDIVGQPDQQTICPYCADEYLNKQDSIPQYCRACGREIIPF